MKILVVNWQDLTNPQAGGAEVHLEEILRRLVSHGHEITLLCSGYPGARREEIIKGVKIIRRGRRFNFNLVAPGHLRRLARTSPFDILIEDINKIPFYTPLYMKLPTLVVVPHLFSTTVFREINFLLGTYIYLAEKPLVAVYRGRKFNVISESTAFDIAQRGIPREDISVVHCGIDKGTFAYDATIPKYARPTILYLGRIKKYKSIDHLLLAYKKVQEIISEADLIIVGSGDYTEPLKKLARKLGLEDKVQFKGFVSSKDKVEYLRRSHVAVYPSLKEGWGLTNIEANACGTAVVAADVPGLRDSVDNGRTGFLYRYGDIEDLAAKLKTVLMDTTLRTSMEINARQWAARFDWDKAADEFEKILLNTAGNRP